MAAMAAMASTAGEVRRNSRASVYASRERVHSWIGHGRLHHLQQPCQMQRGAGLETAYNHVIQALA